MSEELPAGWQSAALRDIAEIVGGVTKDTKKSAGSGFREVPYLRVANVQRGRLDLTEVKVIAASEADIQKLNLLPGDILLNEGGDRDKLGRGWIWQGQLSECIHQNHVFRARLLSREIDPVYVAHFTNSVAQTYFAAHGSQTTNLASISLTKLGSLPVPLPPAAEQSRIVAKLEELLSDLDAGVAELKAAQAKVQQYRQSLLKAAVEGSLTQAWREAHPAPEETGADLLARILRERRARWEAQQLAKFEAQGKQPPKGWQAKYVEPGNPGIDAAPALPTSWAWATVGQLLAALTSGSRDWAPYYDRGSCVFVMAQNVRPWRPNFAFRQLVDPPANDRDRARSQIAMDDLLVTIVGANTGQSCRVPEALDHHFVCQSVALLRPVDPSMSEYLNAVLNSEGHGQRQFRAMNYGAGRPHLSFEQIESVLVPLPPLAEQVEILSCVTEKLASIDEQVMQLERLLHLVNAQRQNLLRAAFAGQLVPQDPADEPAAELLARIRADRATREAARTPRAKPVREAKSLNSVETIPVGAVE
ncbi:MAG: restriction endonuclease subunit S [Pelomonas sp.]|nr:restriction endonuclease subunit S [Roseateles sp.]